MESIQMRLDGMNKYSKHTGSTNKKNNNAGKKHSRDDFVIFGTEINVLG